MGLDEDAMRGLAGPDRVRRASSVGDKTSTSLARWRAAAGLSSAELARRIYVSEALVSRWQSGERAPARRLWPALAAVLNIDAELLAAEYNAHPAPSDLLMTTGLRRLRAARGLTQHHLAGLVHVDVSTIQRWERTGQAPVRQARRLAVALGVPASALVGRPVPPRPPRPVTALRHMRRTRGLPAKVVAARVGVSPSALLAWERGDNQPSWYHARLLARVLQAPIGHVFTAAGLTAPKLLSCEVLSSSERGLALRELRRWHGLTAAEFARKLGVAETTIISWERGRHQPRGERLRALVALLSPSNEPAESELKWTG